MTIVEEKGSSPVAARPYRVSSTERKEIADIIEEWKRTGVIRETSSPYASPVLLVGKKDGTKILCVDYRHLNRQTRAEPYPMANVDNQLSALSAGRMFVIMDLTSGYLHSPMSSESKEKTAFITPDTTAQFERMTFGLRNAPCEFQKLMDKVFYELKMTRRIHCYLDDIILSCKDWEDLMCVLRLSLEALKQAKLTLKPSKCVFGLKKFNYFGFQISNGQISPGNKVEAIENYAVPIDAHEVCRFLGHTGFF